MMLNEKDFKMVRDQFTKEQLNQQPMSGNDLTLSPKTFQQMLKEKAI